MAHISEELSEELKAKAIAARRAARLAWQRAHFDKLDRDREAKVTAREYKRQAQLSEGPERTKLCTTCRERLPLDRFSPSLRHKATGRCKSCNAANAKKVYQRKRGATGATRTQTLAPERQREVTARVDHLSALLMGAAPGQRINDEETWESACSELKWLWSLSGDKVCHACKAVVPASAMRAPGPGNSYPGKCNRCVTAEYRAVQLRVFGKVSEGPPQILLRDGSSITVAEFARRVAERSQGFRVKHSS